MTEEERQKLCEWLRHLPGWVSDAGIEAADEIERLAGRNEAILAVLRTVQSQYEEMGDRAQNAERELMLLRK